ncbi:hypothetical protein ASF30_07380 [Leifsonia sp. Leaf264]|nr:hypothetical protein ASF30_07380 [Leifsonia sp. Leaf264]
MSIGGFEYDGNEPIELNELVTWNLFLPAQPLPGGATYLESHLGRQSHVPPVTGRIVQVDAVTGGGLVEITRLPSAVSDEQPIETWDGTVLSDIDDYVVTLDIADGTELPTSSALLAGWD